MSYQPIHRAAEMGNVSEVRRLLQCGGANVDVGDVNGNTPLIFASTNGQLEVVKYLVEEAGANVEIENNDGKTALDMARGWCGYGCIEVGQYLEQHLRQGQWAGLPTFPSLPSEPQFTSNQAEFASTLEQWVHRVELVLSDYVAAFAQWKEGQNQSCQAKIEAIDDEIAQLEMKKASIQQENTGTVSLASGASEASVRACRCKIADTREIIRNLRGGGRRPPRASNTSANQDDQSPPVSLCCPITLQLMTDPVMIFEDGHTYERSAILQHWRTQESQGIPITSPQTNQQISSKQLAPNLLVRSQCREWQDQHPNWSS